jgi:hypothetical protein
MIQNGKENWKIFSVNYGLGSFKLEEVDKVRHESELKVCKNLICKMS